MDVAPPSVAVIARSASWKEGRRRGGGRRGWPLHPSSPACFGGVRREGGDVLLFPREHVLVSGRSGSGKPLMTADLALKISERGCGTMNGKPPPPATPASLPLTRGAGLAGKGGIRGRTRVAAGGGE